MQAFWKSSLHVTPTKAKKFWICVCFLDCTYDLILAENKTFGKIHTYMQDSGETIHCEHYKLEHVHFEKKFWLVHFCNPGKNLSTDQGFLFSLHFKTGLLVIFSAQYLQFLFCCSFQWRKLAIHMFDKIPYLTVLWEVKFTGFISSFLFLLCNPIACQNTVVHLDISNFVHSCTQN